MVPVTVEEKHFYVLIPSKRHSLFGEEKLGPGQWQESIDGQRQPNDCLGVSI
jgi:hypothetical protein